MTPLVAKLAEALPLAFALLGSALLGGLAMSAAPVEVVAAIGSILLCVGGWQASRGARLLNRSIRQIDEWKEEAEELRGLAEATP